MPHFNAYDFIKWLHLIALAMGGGAAMVTLVLTGFEDSRDDLKGMTSLLWKRTAAWGFRLAVVLGLALLFMRIHASSCCRARTRGVSLPPFCRSSDTMRPSFCSSQPV